MSRRQSLPFDGVGAAMATMDEQIARYKAESEALQAALPEALRRAFAGEPLRPPRPALRVLQGGS